MCLDDGYIATDVFLQLISGQRSVTFDDSCSDTAAMSSQLPAAAAAAAGNVSTCYCLDADTINISQSLVSAGHTLSKPA